MKANLYLARHGETKWNKVQRFQGQLDSELTTKGRQQARNIAERLEKSNISHIISSPLGRAITSAQICQEILKIPHQTESDLTERHLGHWQGQQLKNIQASPDYQKIFQQFTQAKPLGGESAIDCAQRISQVLEQIAKAYLNKNVLVICHGEALRCLLAKQGYHSNASAYELFNNGDIIHLSYQHQIKSFQLHQLALAS
ncbi:hypothetical protein tinsulaeT_31010 [Thalassotalea insulae]|uniref:Phosphoglycerate mutase n=1 Tax=Thalassotalea insulae TaxID=2056778 RepID=A0ABQ6GZV7_9GAMM|nr:histidine phosphatase family protein [Thalassotalea insulae]GLX79761.1 hypothetical protein tinsulaeT_31010 [Thalassotalea insulae]